jgi:Fe-S-cluster containining protein
MPRKPFYAEGIRFECQGSGRCCTSRGSYGYVYLTEKDQKRFAKYFKLTRAQFLKQYCKEHQGWQALKDPDELGIKNHPKGDCVFLEGGNRCGVYEARPEHCRTWPFWPENMTPKAWNKEVASYCPGVGKGRLYSYDEIQEILKKDQEV